MPLYNNASQSKRYDEEQYTAPLIRATVTLVELVAYMHARVDNDYVHVFKIAHRVRMEELLRCISKRETHVIMLLKQMAYLRKAE